MYESMKRRRSPPLILVVDDDSGTRLLASASLGKAGFTTVEAADGDYGIQPVGGFRPDLTPLDVMIPRLDGFSALPDVPHASRRGPDPHPDDNRPRGRGLHSPGL